MLTWQEEEKSDKVISIVHTTDIFDFGFEACDMRFFCFRYDEFESKGLMWQKKSGGWLLRETGKHDEARLKAWLEPRCATMPRTMLRYAIEKFDWWKKSGFWDSNTAPFGYFAIFATLKFKSKYYRHTS